MFHQNILELKEVLKRNMYPPKIIDKEIRKYLDKTFKDNNETVTNIKKTNYSKLPYLGIISKKTKKKLSKLCDEFCTQINITLSFTTCKIGSFFSTKSKAPSNLESFVVYKYICAGCSASYIGETTRHFCVRIN